MTLFIIMISLVAIAWIAVFYIGFCRKNQASLENDNPQISINRDGVFSDDEIIFMATGDKVGGLVSKDFPFKRELVEYAAHGGRACHACFRLFLEGKLDQSDAICQSCIELRERVKILTNI